MLFFICQTATKPIPTTVTMMPAPITMTIHPQYGVSFERFVFTSTIGFSGDRVSECAESITWIGTAFVDDTGEGEEFKEISGEGKAEEVDVCDGIDGEVPTVIFLTVSAFTVKLYS